MTIREFECWKRSKVSSSTHLAISRVRHKTRCEVSKRNLRGMRMVASLPLLPELEWVSLQNWKTGEREGNLAGISPLAGTPGMILVVIADPQMLHRGFFSLTTVEKWNWIEFEFDSCLGHSPPGLSLVKCAEEVAPATAAMVVLVVCCRWWGKVERAGRTS